MLGLEVISTVLLGDVTVSRAVHSAIEWCTVSCGWCCYGGVTRRVEVGDGGKRSTGGSEKGEVTVMDVVMDMLGLEVIDTVLLGDVTVSRAMHSVTEWCTVSQGWCCYGGVTRRVEVGDGAHAAPSVISVHRPPSLTPLCVFGHRPPFGGLHQSRASSVVFRLLFVWLSLIFSPGPRPSQLRLLCVRRLPHLPFFRRGLRLPVVLPPWSVVFLGSVRVLHIFSCRSGLSLQIDVVLQSAAILASAELVCRRLVHSFLAPRSTRVRSSLGLVVHDLQLRRLLFVIRCTSMLAFFPYWGSEKGEVAVIDVVMDVLGLELRDAMRENEQERREDDAHPFP
ncbi:uncharacterized protein G2W53_039657 [Senna tora]|uniref:Uncharacterized protein n=1 Tax=Senna tora TaxID=362788 RepID=A0A834SPW5_9FABA|nr:uncharacterized protein G2W53_039657 [Senna tora]